MSWSVNYVGYPENIVAALEKSEGRDPQSQQEFEEAKPHLIGLLKQNFADEQNGGVKPVIKLTAHGHAYRKSVDGQDLKVTSNCSVSIEPFYTALV
jgi:hypothetical protein